MFSFGFSTPLIGLTTVPAYPNFRIVMGFVLPLEFLVSSGLALFHVHTSRGLSLVSTLLDAVTDIFNFK